MELHSLRRSIQHVLLSSAMLLAAQASAEQADQANSNKQTGSRLTGNNSSTSQAVTIYTREDILRSGESNAADFIRSLPNNSFGSYRPQIGTSNQGDAYVSMRGLGSSRSLVLIDGRRMPKSPSSAVAANLSLLPMGAIEKIEVLAEGASAIYGSNAIGGVINVITRTDFQGAEIMLGTGNPSISTHGGEREEGSVVFGTSSTQSSLVAGISWNDRETVFERDVPWRNIGRSVYGNSFTTLTDGFDDFNWTSFISACDFPNTPYYTIENTDSLNGTRCTYDFSAASSDESSSENKSFYVNASHNINDQWSIQTNTRFSQAESFGRYAPVPDSSYFSTPLSANSPNNPTNPLSPLYDPSLGLDPQQVNWWHRFEPLGNRDNTVTSQILDLTFAVQGHIGHSQVYLGLRHTNNRMAEVGKNLLLRSATQALVEDGSYSLADPFTTPEYVLNAMKFTAYREARYDQNELFFTLNFGLFSFKSRQATVVMGAEFLQETYLDSIDPQSQAGQIVGIVGQDDHSAIASRDTRSVFLEAHFPVLNNFNIGIASRYDDYSDIGEDIAGKLSFHYQPIESLSLLATYSTNHQTPNLNMLGSLYSSSIVRVRENPQNCWHVHYCTLTIIENVKPNLNLESEYSKQMSFLLNFNPKNWVGLSLNYWHIKIEDKLRWFGSQELIRSEVSGDAIPAGLGCNRSPTGSIRWCDAGYGNGGTLDISGLDLKAEFTYPLFNGNFTNQLVINHILDYEENEDSINLIGSHKQPEQRAVLNNTFILNNWEIAYNINMIGSQTAESDDHLPTPTWITHDVQLSYQLPWQNQLTIGAKNIGEKYPPINGRDYNFSLYDGFGRIVYARYTQTF
ncbi:MAG: TonB-dependent receptor domain-containing protein [Marinicella sp.]